MNLFTSYFGRHRTPDKNTLYLAITAYPPKWWSGDVYSKVAPPKELVLYYKNSKARLDQEELRKEYILYYKQAVLDKLSPADVYSELESMMMRRNKENVVLLCFETSNSFCHRHILSTWFRLNGLHCEELI